MKSNRAGTWGTVLLEICGSLLLVLVLFALFIAFLYALFPSATPLKELMAESVESASGRYAGGTEVEATLASLQHDVRYRRGNSIAWGGASEGMPLYSQDAVQTMDGSGAAISFSPGDRLFLGSNSLIVVTRLDAEDDEGPRSYRVQVDGELRGSLSSGRKLGMEVAAAGHLARISPGAARFRLTPGGDGNESLAIYAGEARVMTGRGNIRVPANFGVMLKKGGGIGPVVPLPAPPALSGDRKAEYRYRLLPPRVRFCWTAPPGQFHFQLSADRAFGKCLIDEKVPSALSAASAESAGVGAEEAGGGRGAIPANNLRATKGAPATSPIQAASRKGSLASHRYITGKLSHGSYFWRVSRVDEGREGAFSQVGECRLVQVLGSPELKVNFPPEKTAAGAYLLTGSAPPGSRVYLDGSEITAGDHGEFAREVRLKPGVNLIRVEAYDPAGNASYASRIVYGRSEAEVQGTAPSTPSSP